MDDEAIGTILHRLSSAARDQLRYLLIRDLPDRDAIAERLLRRRTAGSDDLAEFIDLLSLDDEARRQVVRILGELEARDAK